MRILISGRGGHGVKVGAYILGQIVASHGSYAAIHYEYDAAIRGQNIAAYITISDKKIANPIFNTPDLKFELKELEKTAAEKFGSVIYTTMLAVGKILKELSITINEAEFKKHIQKDPETNWLAVSYFFK